MKDIHDTCDFDNLSDSCKRIVIARDVLAQIGDHHIIPKQGTFIHFINYRTFDNNWKCKACALGSLAISKLLFEKCKLLDGIFCYNERDFCKSKLGFFSIHQLSLIERFFEGWGDFSYTLHQYPDSTSRLRAIMENIIENKGTFIPP